ncbi:MAG TPA: sugar phosphate nucleotidyltransferase [Gemmatimonadaceae bacterium]|nr:sugar phosphate nucleotidyltransferase [Gemmatimonadaceae bacterium]
MTRWGVVLAGGTGSRFWPLSTPSRPKQLLALIDRKPLVVNTVERFLPIVDPERILILTNEALVGPIQALLPALPRENVIAEPKPAGTAAALTWAAIEIGKRSGNTRDAVMLSVHADWAIGDAERFRECLTRAADAAVKHQALVTVGVVPTRPDPGFGYIEPGETLEGQLRKVARFLEKPGREEAERLIAAGCLWNSGIFVWRTSDFLEEVTKLTPEVAEAIPQHVNDRVGFFAAVKSVSVDVGVLERSGRVVVLPGAFGWDDVGTWSALRRVRALDADGNAASGPVYAIDSSGNVIHSADGVDVVLYGVNDLVVIAQRDLTLVTSIERAADLKELLNHLPPSVRERS